MKALKYFSFLLFFTFFFPGFSKTFSQTAMSVLQKVRNTIQTSGGISANFSYTVTNSKGVVETQSAGKLLIKGNKFYVKEGESEIYCNGQTVWNFNGENEVIQTELSENSTENIGPYELLSGAYDKNYNYQLLSSTSPYYTIQITPKDARKNFKKIILYVHQKKNLVTKATVTDKRENRFQFVFSSLQTHLSIPDTKFVFNEKEHPGVEVIKQ